MTFRIDFKSGKPAYHQIIEQVQAASGELRPGDALPSVGMLAEELRVNRNAISRAYGDRLVIYTDGVTEAVDLKDEEFGEERLIAILRKSGTANAAELRSRIMSGVAEFCHNDFPDDATLLTVCVE